MPNFLVESYLAATNRAQFGELAHLARAVESSKGIRHLGSLVLLEDEICFHVFEAPSVDALAGASELVGLAHDRIVEAIWIAATPEPKVVESV